MMPEILSNQLPILLFFALAVVITVVMFVFQTLRERRAHLTQTQLLHHTDDETLKHLKSKVGDQLDKYYKDSLASIIEEYKSRFGTQAQEAEKGFIEYLEDLKTRSIESQNLLSDTSHQNIQDLFTHLESNLKNMIDQTVDKTITQIQAELEASKQNVDQYTQKQLSLIDQNLIDLLERTLSLVLVKKLTLRDQLDLVYEALEQAKVEKFLVTQDQAPSGSTQPTTGAQPQVTQPSQPTTTPQPTQPPQS